MRDRHGAARLDLLLKERDDGAVGAQHVAEAHGDELGVLALAADGLYDHFAEALGGAHDVGRVDGFIRRDLHEDVRAVLVRTAGDVERAEDVVFDGLVGACLHERNVFVRRRVEDDLRPVLCKDVLYLAAVAHAADEHQQVEPRHIVQKFLLDVVGVVLVDVEDDELFGSMGRDLTAELAADGAAPARYKHHALLDDLQNFAQVDFHLLAAEKVGDLHGAHLLHHCLARDELIDTGQNFDLAARGDADLVDAVDARFGRGGHGDEDLLDGVFLGDAPDVLRAADHFHALELGM